MKAILGQDKMMVTDKIDLLLGRFADTRGKLLVCLNEAKGKDTFTVDNLLKDYITRTTCEVEKKGVDAFTAQAYDRLRRNSGIYRRNSGIYRRNCGVYRRNYIIEIALKPHLNRTSNRT